jgi:hypothetical protein
MFYLFLSQKSTCNIHVFINIALILAAFRPTIGDTQPYQLNSGWSLAVSFADLLCNELPVILGRHSKACKRLVLCLSGASDAAELDRHGVD